LAIPLQIISGFLGAGKTTAIRAELEQRSGERVAIIVNDFGEASLDQEALAEGEPFRITNIPGACVCCTAPEGFVDALGAVLDAKPERILIEPTGLARPQDLVDTVRRSAHAGRVEVAPVVVLVDPGLLARGGSLVREQVEGADVLVANRTDLANSEELDGFRQLAAALWPEPLAVYETTHGVLPRGALDWPPGEGPRRRGAVSDHDSAHSTHGFAARSWIWPEDAVFSRDRLTDALARLATGRAGAPLARLKGIFRTQEGVYRLEVAGGAIDERLTSFRRDSRVDVIVESEDSKPLELAGEWLEAARLSEDELELAADRIDLVLGDGRLQAVDRDLLLGLPDPVADVSRLFPKRQGRAARIESLWRALELPEEGSVVIVAGDGFATEPVPIPTFRAGVLLHSLADVALPADQGGPFRLLIPEEANPPSGACANVKAVAKLVLRA
jgi:G3E family GTPase